MKRTHLIAVLAGLAAIAIITADASAMYNPRTGTFMQRDPGPGAGSPVRIGAGGRAVSGSFAQRDPQPAGQYADGMNLYQYVGNRPTNALDPTGTILFVMSGAHRPKADMDRLKNLTRDAILREVGPFDRAASPMMFVQRSWWGPLTGFYDRALRRAYKAFKERKAKNKCSLEQFVAIGHSSGASAIYNEIKGGTFNQSDPRLVPAYLGMIDRVLPLGERHDLTGSLGGMQGTLVDDFYGAWRGEVLPGASLSYDVSRGGAIEDPYPDTETGKKTSIPYPAMPDVGHIEMTGASHEGTIGTHAVLDQMPFRAREVYLKRVREEQKRLGPPPSWDTSKPENGW